MDGLSFAVPGGLPVAVVLLLAFGGLVAWGFWETRALPARRRVSLRALRLSTAVMAWLCAVQPRLVREEVEEVQGRLAVLVDGSRSMTIARDGASRWDEARAALEGLGRGERQPELFRFGSTLAPLDWADVSEFAPRDDESGLAAALEELAGDDDLGAVIVVGDGASRESERLPDLDGLKVHAVSVGGDRDLRDDAIAELQADPVAFLRGDAQVRVVVRALGEGGTIPVSLVHEGAVIREALVEVEADSEAEVTLSFSPRRLGRAVYHVRIPRAADDAVPENNERSFLVRVSRDRLRVLLVAGHPTWDVRFLRSFLEADPSIDLISFFILRTTSDLTMANPDELALIPFPTDELFREHLGSFDVLLFQDFDFGPYQMASYLPRIRDYVRRGGSFAMIGGERSFGAGGYADTPIAEILPVELRPATSPPGELFVDGRFQPAVVPELARHPLVALSPDATASAELWARLAPLEGANRIRGRREGAQVLLEHPRARVEGGALPLLTVAESGEGRVLALGVDTTWRWGMTTAGAEGDGSGHERFWDRTLRWLARDPSLDPARITTDRERYGPGGRVSIGGWLRDRSYRPIPGAARVEVVTADDEVVAAAPVRPSATGEIEAVLRAPLEPGAHRVVARLEGEAEPLALEPFVVEAGGDELADPRPDPERLQRLAEATGGRYVASGAGLPALDAFDTTRRRSAGTRETRPLGGTLALLLALGLLAVELFPRRRWGLR